MLVATGALAMVLAASLVLAETDLRRAKMSFQEMHAEFLLAGDQELASAIVAGNAGPRLAWSIPESSGPVLVVAESEAAKLDVRALSSLRDEDRRTIGLQPKSGGDLSTDLGDYETFLTPALEGLSPSLLWRACARSVTSPFGRGQALAPITTAEPAAVQSMGHVGEVWRIRVSAEGWSDDRLVRFIGQPLHPAAVLARSFYRSHDGPDQCKQLLANL